jgi:hypothetical protein
MVPERESGTQIEDDLDYCLELMMSEPHPDEGMKAVKCEPRCRTEEVFPLVETAHWILKLTKIKPRSEFLSEGKQKMLDKINEKFG